MQSKIFIGISFYPGSQQKKINGFRQRFDSKYFNQKESVMSLVAPFEIEDVKIKYLAEELEEELESYFYGHETNRMLTFMGMDIFVSGKNKILYLNPLFGSDLEFTQEKISEVCKDFIPNREVRQKLESKKMFMPIGRFQDSESLQNAVNQAQKEITFPLEMPLAHISIFKKMNNAWSEEHKLVSFLDDSNTFLQMDM
ncbi:MAG: hypothetical protein JNM93_06050 [Bacteriovoracaceae bacterium]|nr:hypothetical protein [Bacteriovoracaceae bacterium]